MNKEARGLPEASAKDLKDLGLGPKHLAEAPAGTLVRRGKMNEYHSDMVALHHPATDFVVTAQAEGFDHKTLYTLYEVMDHLLDQQANPGKYDGSVLSHQLTTEKMD